MNKTKVEAMIKRSSLIVMIIAALETALSGTLAVMAYQTSKELHPAFNKIMLGECSNYAFNGATFFIEMIIFYRIFQSGRPFTNGNIMAVRVIAVLAVIGAAIKAALSYSDVPSLLSVFLKLSFPVLGAVVFLFFAEIMRYGNLLQTESDETL